MHLVTLAAGCMLRAACWGLREPRSRVGPGCPLRALARGHMRCAVRANLVASGTTVPPRRRSKPPPQSQAPAAPASCTGVISVIASFCRLPSALPLITPLRVTTRDTADRSLPSAPPPCPRKRLSSPFATSFRTASLKAPSTKRQTYSSLSRKTALMRPTCTLSSPHGGIKLTHSLAYRALALAHLERFDEAEKVGVQCDVLVLTHSLTFMLSGFRQGTLWHHRV